MISVALTIFFLFPSGNFICPPLKDFLNTYALLFFAFFHIFSWDCLFPVKKCFIYFFSSKFILLLLLMIA